MHAQVSSNQSRDELAQKPQTLLPLLPNWALIWAIATRTSLTSLLLMCPRRVLANASQKLSPLPLAAADAGVYVA